MSGFSRRQIIGFILALFLVTALDLFTPRVKLLDGLNRFCYDKLMEMHQKLTPLPPETKDILLVTIDDQTLKKIGERWPFSREKFATVLENLKKAGARVIGFDFVFYGNSSPEDDGKLSQALQGSVPIVLAATVDEDGRLERSTVPALGPNTHYGLVSKIQDSDHVVRKNLTYVVSEYDRDQKILSWEMEILRAVKPGALISEVPVADPVTSAFWIHFRAHSEDFARLSFYRAYRGDFDPERVRNKIVLIGFLSAKLQDIHNTPLGWMPGITLNANAFLTLVSKKFLHNIPKAVEIGLFGVLVLLQFLFRKRFMLKNRWSLLAIEIVGFYVLSAGLMASGFVWNYVAVPLIFLMHPLLRLEA